MQDDFNKWCDLWDKAQKDGIFDDAPKPPSPSPQTSDAASFFGLVNTHSTNTVRDCDAQYWNDVYELTKNNDPQPRYDNGEELLQEETTKSVLGKSADAIARSPNPIHPASVGTDQDLTPGSLGLTFSEKDIEELSELKLQLHELTSKMASFEGEGKKAKQLESKLTALKKKIDEFSDELTHSLGDKKNTQGVELSPMR